MTTFYQPHIGENDCPVILVKGVLFAVALSCAKQFPTSVHTVGTSKNNEATGVDLSELLILL